MKNVIRIIALGAVALAQFSTASAEAPVFDWEKPGYQVTTDPGITRVQVRAEAIEARRLGLSPRGDSYMPIATPEQLATIELAGLRAVKTQVTSGAR